MRFAILFACSSPLIFAEGIANADVLERIKRNTRDALLKFKTVPMPLQVRLMGPPSGGACSVHMPRASAPAIDPRMAVPVDPGGYPMPKAQVPAPECAAATAADPSPVPLAPREWPKPTRPNPSGELVKFPTP